MEMNWDGSKFQEVYTYKDHDPINVVREVSNGKMKVVSCMLEGRSKREKVEEEGRIELERERERKRERERRKEEDREIVERRRVKERKIERGEKG